MSKWNCYCGRQFGDDVHALIAHIREVGIGVCAREAAARRVAALTGPKVKPPAKEPDQISAPMTGDLFGNITHGT